MITEQFAAEFMYVNQEARAIYTDKPPKYETSGSAGVDLRACSFAEPSFNKKIMTDTKAVVIPAGEKVKVGCGIHVWLKRPWACGMILPRSGIGSTLEIHPANLVGLIDSDYQGELIVWVKNNGKEDFQLDLGARFCQFAIVPCLKIGYVEVDKFSHVTGRGDCGHGSTGDK